MRGHLPRTIAGMKKEIYELTYQTEESHWWYVARRRVILSWLTRSLATTGQRVARTPERSEGAGAQETTGLRLLDYGCGTGMNLVHLAKMGAAFGVDPAPEAIAFCRERGLQNV